LLRNNFICTTNIYGKIFYVAFELHFIMAYYTERTKTLHQLGQLLLYSHRLKYHNLDHETLLFSLKKETCGQTSTTFSFRLRLDISYFCAGARGLYGREEKDIQSFGVES